MLFGFVQIVVQGAPFFGSVAQSLGSFVRQVSEEGGYWVLWSALCALLSIMIWASLMSYHGHQIWRWVSLPLLPINVSLFLQMADGPFTPFVVLCLIGSAGLVGVFLDLARPEPCSLAQEH